MRSGSLAYLLTLATDDTSVPDAELLARFAGNGDATAFELLVRRHADLVWRVCRCELPHDAHSAEDAFQTTFLVLARKAGSVRGSTVASYLFRVARNAALRVRKRVGNVAEATVEMGVQPAEPNECSVAVIEEVERLPDKFRLPVLLCFFEDCTHVEAANRLGWAVGTVASRLARAKDRLRVQLTHRGMALPAILAGVSVPAATVRAAVMMATTPSAVPTLLAELTREVSIVMANAKAKWIGGGILAALLLTGSVGMMALTAGPEEPNPATKDKPVAKAPAPETPEAAELRKLQGVWRVTKFETGHGVAPAKGIEPMRWEFVGNTVFTTDGPEESQKLKMQVVLDLTKSPKQMLATGRTRIRESVVENKAEGIYELKGDTLRFCSSAPGTPFPTEFKVGKSGRMGLIEFERLPAKAKPEDADLKKLQGQWRVTRLETGRGLGLTKEIEPMRMDVVGNQFNFIFETGGGGDAEVMKVDLDSSKSPKEITFTAMSGPKAVVGKTMEGIYVLNGDKLRICMADFDKARPPATELVKFDKNRLIDFERIPDLKTLQEEERKKLQGKWQATRMENSVQGVANAEVLKKVQCDFVGDNFTEIQGDTVEKSQFVLDPTKMPKQITLTWKDDRKNKIKALGIYEFNGDRLRICTSIVEGKPRPTSFTVTKENQVTLCEYDRIPYTIRDLKDLAGEWKYSVMEDGKELSGGTMDIYRDVIWQTDEGQTEKAIVSLDSEKGFLDITPLTGPSAAPRKPLLGRFTWKDGILTIYSGDPGAERPAEAKAGKGVTVAVMVRVVKK